MAYGRRVLFHDVCAQVAPGETLVVTGANGAGKSTLLKIIAGPGCGPKKAALRLPTDARGLGYAAPDVQLYAELTGDENLEFFRPPARPAARRGRRTAGAGRAAAARAGGDPVGAYSSGMRQRLKLAVSLLGDPPLLVWDEPTATLDAAGRAAGR